MLIYNDSKIEGIFNSYLINFRFDTKYSKYELELKDIRKVLQDLSILLCYDLEPCHDIICAKFSNIKGISYPFFKECLYNFLDKKEGRLNTMFMAEQNSIPLEDAKVIGKNYAFNKNNYDENENIEEVKITDDLNLIILHRSLYILKKKFELNKQQFKEIYNKYSEKFIDLENKGEILENEILVEKNKVSDILVELINAGKFEIDEINNFKEVIFKEMEFTNNINVKSSILKEFMDYVNENRRKYNYIYKEKKINKNFQLESYLDYIPQGDDELTKIVIETEGTEKDIRNEKNDAISEIVANKLKFHEINKESNNDLISEISKNKNIKKEKAEKDNDKDSFNGEILVEKKKVTEKNEENEEEEESENEEKEENEENKKNEEEKKNKLINKNKIKKNSFYSEIDNKKTIKYSKNFLYIEALPLIIADFISNQNKTYAIIDHGDELRNDLRTLFDNEILGRLGEKISYEINRNKMEQLKDLLINKAKVEKNISCYEDLLYQMRTHNQNVSFILITINKLKDTLNWIEKKINVIQDDTNTFNDYENNLQIKKLNEEIKQQKNAYNKKENKKQTKKHIIKTIKNENKDDNMINENYNNNINNISFKNNENEILLNNESKKDNENNSRRLSEISDLSILKLENKIEGMDTARLIDSHLINKDNEVFRAKINKNSENTNNKNLNFFNYKYNNNKKVILPKIKSKNDLSKEEKRELSIKEIFNFYSHQHSNAGHKATFDSIREKFEHLNISEFSKFCSEFKILIPKEKLVEIFKKSSALKKEMSFQEFKLALSKISIAINEDKINQLKRRIKHFKNTLDYNNKNITIENLKKEQVDELIKKCQEDIKLFNKKTNEELLEEFYEYLQIDDEEKYHQKMKGFVLPLFQGGILHTMGVEPTTKNVPVKINIGRQIYIKEMIEKRKEQKKSIEKNVMRVNGLDREYQKKKIDKNNDNINLNNNIFSNKSSLGYYKKTKLEPIKQTGSNYSDTQITNKTKKKIIDDILNINKNNISLYYENNSNDNSKIKNRYEKNNLKLKGKNNNNELKGFPRKINDLINDQEAEKEVSEQLDFKVNNLNPLLLKNKNNISVKENKYTWDSLEKMKSSSLVDENELNKLIT